MVRAVLTLSIACVLVAAILISGQATQQLSINHQFGSSFRSNEFGDNSPTAFRSPLRTTSFGYNTKSIGRNSASDSHEEHSTNLIREGNVAPGSETFGTEQVATDTDVASNPDVAENSTVTIVSGQDTTTSKNQSNVLSITPSPLKTLYIDITKPGLGSPITQPVFKENAFVGLFNSCSKLEINERTGTVEDDMCFQDDKYNDRIVFEMTYLTANDVIENAFQKHPPKLSTQDGADDIATPSIFVTDVSRATSTAKVVVLYNCKAASGSIYLSLHLNFGESEASNLSIPWTKTCSTGENDKISFGYVQDKDSASNKIDFNNSEASALVVAPSDVSTEVYLKLQQPGAQQAFLAPYVTSSKREVTEVLVRGNHPSGGVLNGLEETLFQVSYNCEQKGSTEIHVSVALPPFDNMTASWIKGPYLLPRLTSNLNPY
ncbi:hypothetical protein FGB62_22g352 [Gracilaria domingensis]|nr:hypothetical protein FGB62_22g352 [Gracilaria domingensis]